MRNSFRLFIALGTAVIIATAAYFPLVLIIAPRFMTPSVPRAAQAVALAVTVLLPIIGAALWMARKLRAQCTQREARIVAIAFAVFTPVSMLIAIPLAQIPGGYAGFLGRPFGFVGAFAGIVVITTFLSFVPIVLALWITRRIGRPS